MSEITNNPSVPTQVVAEVKFPNFITSLGIIPTSYKDSMSYYECLAWLCKFLEETVIPTVNQNGLAVEELQNLYIQLNSYVSNYFENLDVQEEINNKLDDMVEAGTLQEIVADYLNSKAVFGFNTIEDMQDSTNLINGSFAKTLGYHSLNDGGSALYKIRNITNEDVIDNMLIIPLNNSETLIAEIILPIVITPEIFGAYGDGTHDDTDSLQLTFKYPNICLSKTYLISDTLEYKDLEHFNINAKTSKIVYTGDDQAIKLKHLRWGTIDLNEIRSDNGSGVLMESIIGTADRITYLTLNFKELHCNNKNIEVNIQNSGFINEINVSGGRIYSGDYGFYFYNACSDSSGCNAWRINNIGFEGCDTCFYYETSGDAARFYGHDIKNSRYIEHNTSTILNIKGTFYRCNFESWGLLKMSRLDFTDSNIYDFNFKGYIYDEDLENLLYTGFYKNDTVTYYYNDRYTKKTLTTTNNLTSGNVYVHKEKNLAIFQFDNIVVNDTASVNIVDVGDNDILPPVYFGIAKGMLCSTDAQNVAYAFIRTNGSISIKVSDKTKTYCGMIMFYTDVFHN